MGQQVAPDWKTVSEYAKAKGLTIHAVYKRIQRGRIKWTKKGSFYLVKDS